MPRFLHTSDWHLNALRKYPGYLKRVRRSLRSILEIARHEKVDFIAVSGDLFDRLDITHEERSLLSEWLHNCEFSNVMISGNHDKRTEVIGDTCIKHLSSLGEKLVNHHIYDGPPTVKQHLGCQFILLPYQRWTDQEYYLIMQALLSKTTSYDGPIIVLMHEAISGCKADNGHKVTKRNQIRLIASDFPEVCYWALGDMHSVQEILPNAWYSGSPHQKQFDETLNKGVLIVDTDNPTKPKFVAVHSANLLTLDRIPKTGWPSEEEAFIKYSPIELELGSSHLPSNVDYEPAAKWNKLVTGDEESNQLFSVYDGLDDFFAQENLSIDLYPLAWTWAIKIAEMVGLKEKLPERYKEVVDNE